MLAPDFDKDTRWLNAGHPISLRELRGCLVILDFWTYCCINCMHVLPVLAEVEEEFRGEPLAVIGVHSGKFDAERDDLRISEAIRRYGIAHPVAVDSEMKIWRKYCVRSWPTLVIVRPDGAIAAVAPGEPDPAMLKSFIRGELAQAKAAGTLGSGYPSLVPDSQTPDSALLYPGKAIQLGDGGIAVSDSGHHRILLCNADGRTMEAAGSGLRGLVNGTFEEAAFDDPQGLAEWGGNLFVADRRNHCIRKINRERRTVETVAGDGNLGVGHPPGPVPAADVRLRSPWDLCTVGDNIYVAMAGNHQVWLYRPIEGTIETYAGTSAEGIEDGPIRGCLMAQPSGLSHLDGILYVADSETSSVRAIDMARGTIRTLHGTGLFDFGDSDGVPGKAAFQHPLGVAATPSGIFVADTYNGKIRRIDHATREVTTVAMGLHEPGGISAADKGLLIADTNAHRMLLHGPSGMTELPIVGAPKPRVGAVFGKGHGSGDADAENWFTNILDLPDGVGLMPGEGEIVLELVLGEGGKFAGGQTIRLVCEVSRRPDLLLPKTPDAHFEGSDAGSTLVGIPLEIRAFEGDSVECEMTAALEYVRCDKEGFCTPLRAQLRIPVRLLKSGSAKLLFAVEL